MTLAQERLSKYNDVLFVSVKDEKGFYHKIAVWAVIEQFLMIKDTHGNLVRFILNEDQVAEYANICETIAANKPTREDLLKARQLGFSTLIAGIIFVLTSFQMDKSAVIIADQSDSASHIFSIYKTFYEALPKEVQNWIPKQSKNAYELSFDYGSGHLSSIRVLTQGEKSGRGFTVQYVHLSECAFFDDLNGTLVSLMQSIANSTGTMMFLETTANGYNEYKEKWDKDCLGNNGFKARFFPWFSKKEYALPYDGHALLPFEEELLKKYNLNKDQIQWYRQKYEELGEDLDMLRQEHPSNPVEAFISTGASVFNKELLSKRKEELWASKPLRKGYFSYEKRISEDGGKIDLTNIKWVESPFGAVSIYEDPIKGHPYFISNDPAMGGNDYWATQVFDNNTCHQVAVFHKSGCDADEAAYQAVCLYKHYGICMLSGETNTTSYLLETANKCGVKNIYQDQDVEDLSGRYINRFGYKTKQNNRQYMVDLFVMAFRDNPKIINDLETLEEMETFQYIQSGVQNKEKAMAESGKHDDLVMAACGFFLCRTSFTSLVSEDIPQKADVPFNPLEIKKDENEGVYIKW